tara:strand:+ start:786 stop:1016 length:231 start_codon:yes stop_codon:yes gene_type:complete
MDEEKKRWQEEIQARDKDIRKKMEEEFGIHKFYDKKKEHANRWANQHRWRNGGRHISEALRTFLKGENKNGKTKSR